MNLELLKVVFLGVQKTFKAKTEQAIVATSRLGGEKAFEGRGVGGTVVVDGERKKMWSVSGFGWLMSLLVGVDVSTAGRNFAHLHRLAFPRIREAASQAQGKFPRLYFTAVSLSGHRTS